MLSIKDLHVAVEEKPSSMGSTSNQSGEVHAIMGPTAAVSRPCVTFYPVAPALR